MKKGISPLIATVMLIMLAVILTFLFFRLEGETVGKGLEKGKEIWEGFNNCEEVEFNVENAYCDSLMKNLVVVKIENEKNVDFRDAFVLRVFYADEEVGVSELSEEVGSFLDNTRLLAYETREVAFIRKSSGTNFAGKPLYKKVDYIEIVPKVLAGQKIQYCQDKMQKIGVENCIEK
tara:strand:- start:2945 stop:3475 length:531 start_codon:yes stop_codon:yes gene_type:complete